MLCFCCVSVVQGVSCVSVVKSSMVWLSRRLQPLSMVWLLASAEVFSTAKRIELELSAGFNPGPTLQGEEQGACVEGGVNNTPRPSPAAQHHPMWRAMVDGVFPKKRSSHHKHHHEAVDVTSDVLSVRGGHAPEAPALVLGGVPISLTALKVILQILLTVLNVACWFVPMKVKRFSESRDLISLANAFSGGVFLSLAFGHMIPHSTHGFEKLDFAHNIPFFVVLGGYLLIFFVEKIAFDTHGFIEEHHHHPHHGNGVATKPTPSPTSALNSGRSAVVLLLALAVHSVFETMALGLADTPIQAALLATSIALHQPAESIALLVAFLKSNLSQQQIIKYLSVFSLVGMVGVFLGLAVNQWASEIWDSVFVALAAGTFIYVGCTEIVAEEFEEPEDKWKKFGSLMAGVLIVGAITVVTEGWEH